MKRRILHILPDEKVVNTFISNMEEVFPGESLYLVFNNLETMRYVTPIEQVRHYTLDSQELRTFIGNVSSYQIVCLHSLDSHPVFRKLKHPNIIWIIWGADLYELLLRRKGYQLYFDQNELYKVRKLHIPRIIYRFVDNIRGLRDSLNAYSISKKVKWVVSLREDYDLLLKYYPNLRCKYLSGFTYYPIEEMIDARVATNYCSGKSIWVNNSAALNGNHVSIFQRLAGFDGSFKVICPLSYGLPRVVHYLEKKGEELLKDRFYAIKDFLPFQDYYNLFLDASFFIFGHLRQCAFGNAVVALYFGGKCFFYKQNPMYQFFIGSGLLVYNIEEQLDGDSILTPLSEEQRHVNRSIILKMYSKNKLRDYITKIFS